METAGLCSTRPVAIVPYLGGLVAVAEDSRLLEYYRLQDGEWKSSPSSSWRCSGEVMQISILPADPASSSSGTKVPCILSFDSTTGDYSVSEWNLLEATPTIRTQVIHTSPSHGLKLMVSSGDVVDVPLDDEIVKKHWQFDWSRLNPCSSMLVLQLESCLEYMLVSSEEGVATQRDSPSAIYNIPSDYTPIIECVEVFWKAGFNGCGLKYVPLFIVGTCYKQLLIFENGATLSCIQLNSVPRDILSLKVVTITS